MKNIIKFIGSLSVLALVLTACGDGGGSKKAATSTLDTTKKQGHVKCGVSQGLPGFSNADASGKWTGIDVDVCRAVAAAEIGRAHV